MSPELKAKLSDPAVQKAIDYWVKLARNQMGQVKSEREIKQMLYHKLGPQRISPMGVTYIYELAKQQFEAQKKIVQSIIGNGNSGVIQN